MANVYRWVLLLLPSLLTVLSVGTWVPHPLDLALAWGALEGWLAGTSKREVTPQELWKNMGNVARSPHTFGAKWGSVGGSGGTPSRNKEARGSLDQGALSLPGLANSKASHMAFPSPFPFSTPAVFLGSVSHVSQQAEISQQAKCPNTLLVLGEGVGSTFSNNRRTENLWWLEATSCFVGLLADMRNQNDAPP